MIQVDKLFIDFELASYHPILKKIGKISLVNILKRKKWSILFFYPADFTFVCPTELADLAKNYEDFQKLNCEIYAVSTDTVYTHKVWVEEEKLLANVKYPILSDHNGKLAKELGIYDEVSGMAQRACYILDQEGILCSVQVVSDNIGRSAGEILRQVKALKFVSENPGLACPASWEEGEKTLKPDISISGHVFEKLKSK